MPRVRRWSRWTPLTRPPQYLHLLPALIVRLTHYIKQVYSICVSENTMNSKPYLPFLLIPHVCIWQRWTWPSHPPPTIPLFPPRTCSPSPLSNRCRKPLWVGLKRRAGHRTHITSFHAYVDGHVEPLSPAPHSTSALIVRLTHSISVVHTTSVSENTTRNRPYLPLLLMPHVCIW